MGWIRCVHCEKLQRHFVARTFVLIEPVQYVFQQVLCSYETILNAPKYYETHRNISLGSNGWIGCFHCEKSRCDFVAQTFALIKPVQHVLHRVSCSYETIPNAPKHWKAPKHDFRVQWGGSGVFVAKNSDATSWHELLHKFGLWHELLHKFGLFCTEFCKATK